MTASQFKNAENRNHKAQEGQVKLNSKYYDNDNIDSTVIPLFVNMIFTVLACVLIPC